MAMDARDRVGARHGNAKERRAWRMEFADLGVRQTADRERASVWHDEKLQEACRWRERSLARC